MDRVPQWLLAQMSTTPASRPVTAETMADYYLFHPDGRIVASFFLGGAFMHALHYLFSSSWVRSLLQRLRTTLYAPLLSRRRRGVQVDPENPATLTLSEKGLGFIREKHQRNESEGDKVESQSVRQYNDHSSLVFVLNLCLLLASFALFLTLLAFRKGWETGCTFVVAWAGMSSQVARLLGMLILILELDALLNLKRWTVWALRGMLAVALVFIFAAQATNTGTTGTPRGAQAAFCYRQFFLATSLVSSIIRLLMEIYLFIRVIMLLWSHKRLFDDDIRVSRPLARVLSLFVFDMMTVVPDATPTTLPAQFIPFSVGAILVMVTFNWKKHTRKTDQTSRVQSLIVFSKPPATGDPLLVPTPFTLHFPREHRTSHSWRSDGGGPIPESSEEQDVLDITGPSRPLSAYSSDSSRRSARSVDNAIITRAVPLYTGSPRTVALPPVTPPSTSYYPVSAPPQLSGFSGSGPAPENQNQNPNVVRKILPSQVEYAAELEREQARLEEEIIRLAQPAVPPLPLDGPRGQLIQRDADEITIYSQSQYRNSTNTYRPMITPASAFFSQDIQRNRSNRKTGRMNSTRSTVNPSPAPTQGSFAFSPYESVRSYFRESYDSRLTRASEDESQVSGASSNGSHDGSIKRKDGNGSASASGKRNTFLSPTDSLSSKLPWKSNNLSRFSLASMRSRSREELPTVREQSPESGERQRQRIFPMPRPTVVIGRVPSSSKRRTFGQAGTPTGSASSGRRASNRPSILNMYGGRPISSLPPMPSTLPTPQRVTPFTPFTASPARSQSQSSSGHGHSHEEVPPVPQIQVRELPVPSLQVLPATPEPAYVPGAATPPPASTNADGTTPAWISRPIRSSIVRGPRPLPSAPIITPGMGRGAGSGWPTALQVSGGPPGISGPSLTAISPASSYGDAGGQLDPRRIDGGSEGYLTRSSTRRTRSNSCPSMYSVDSPVEDGHDGEDARSM